MPIFSYKCRECGEQIDLIRPMWAAGDPIFCDCGEQMERQVERPAARAVGFGGKGGGRRDGITK